MKPYYADDSVTLYHGDCLTDERWLAASVLLTDPPYGRGWKQGRGLKNSAGLGRGSLGHVGIANDHDATTRDLALRMWGERPGVVFGDPLVPQPTRAVQALVWEKPIDSGVKGARAGRRRNVEMIYLTGPWPAGVGGESSVLRTGGLVAGPTGNATIYGHPHAKPVDLMAELIAMTEGVVCDPFAGSGSTLVAAKLAGRRAIGVELEERYCETAARRLSQDVLDFGGAA